jgi:CRISPR-associated protein Cas5t
MVGLFVAVPLASFRVPQAREFFETFPCPPPATVYGMLLSLVGETNRLRHQGAEVAIGLLGKPASSVVLRTTWRVKDKKYGPGQGSNLIPDFQEVLSNLQLAVWVRAGAKEEGKSLAHRVDQVLSDPSKANRFGGLSLGESTFLVNELSSLRQSEGNVDILINDPQGTLALPIWPNHVGSSGTVWGRYRMETLRLSDTVPEQAWTPIVSG